VHRRSSCRRDGVRVYHPDLEMGASVNSMGAVIGLLFAGTYAAQRRHAVEVARHVYDQGGCGAGALAKVVKDGFRAARGELEHDAMSGPATGWVPLVHFALRPLDCVTRRETSMARR
jgi:hypothetical protein